MEKQKQLESRLQEESEKREKFQEKLESLQKMVLNSGLNRSTCETVDVSDAFYCSTYSILSSSSILSLHFIILV